MITHSEILKEVANEKEYRYACKKISNNHELQGDLHSELMIILCEYNPQTIIDLHSRGELRWFIVRILTNMWCSTSSPFYTKYRKFKTGAGSIGKYDETESWDIDKQFKRLPNRPPPASADEYDIDRDINIQQAIDGVNELLRQKKESGNIAEWAEWKVWDLYQEHGSSRNVSKVTGIPATTIRDTVRRMKLIITEKIKFSPPNET